MERGFALMSRQLKCIGILWILFIAAVNSCPDGPGSMDCDILPTDGLTCSYVKGSPKDEPIMGLKVPGPVKNLHVAPGFASVGGECESRLNITWNVSADGSLQYLRGFFLTVSFNYYVDGTDRTVNRTFSVNATEWTPALSETLFVHECMVPVEHTSYHVELYSLPQNYQRHYAFVDIRTANTLATDNQCDRTAWDPNYTYNWTATMWTSANPSNASIEVCFYTAPPSFGFSSYLVSLLPHTDDILNMYLERKNVTVDPLKKTPVCEKFMNVCPGNYKIHVTPDNNPVGTCRKGDEQATCTATVVDSINMTESECRRSKKKVPKSSGGKVWNRWNCRKFKKNKRAMINIVGL